jgi:hypothetical protein
MKRTAVLVSLVSALCFGAAGIANAQTAGAPAGPLPGTGDSTRITSQNRENNAEYNRLIGASDGKSGTANVKTTGKHSTPVAASAADIKAGAALRDIRGVPIGTIASVDGTQAVVDTGQTKIGVPLIAFGKDEQGLMLGMTADKFNQLVAQAHARAQASH